MLGTTLITNPHYLLQGWHAIYLGVLVLMVLVYLPMARLWFGVWGGPLVWTGTVVFAVSMTLVFFGVLAVPFGFGVAAVCLATMAVVGWRELGTTVE